MAVCRTQLPVTPIAAATLAPGLAAIRAELLLPSVFPDEVLREAEAGGPAGLPDAAGWLTAGAPRVDRRELPLVTLDPAGSRDLDQAFAIEPPAAGGPGAWTLHYAIADVAAHVRPGGAIERESRVRGETVYLPDGRVPLHPPALSEGVASLLPDEDRLAVLWSLTIDGTGELTATAVTRALVRSTAQLNYDGAAEALTAGTAHEQLVHLSRLGPLLIEAAGRRGAIELPEPSQELVGDEAAGWTLAWLPRTPIEDWNAQLSLTTGRAAAALMLAGREGLLRTLPPAPADAAPRLRIAAQALGIDWPAGELLADRLARLDPSAAADLTLMDQARTLLRGAGYLALTGQTPTADEAIHAAVAAPYAHVTAPLRRLADRYATEAALAASVGIAAPAWVREALPLLPDLLKASGRRAGSANRAVADLAEATVLQDRVGETFTAAVVEVTKGTAEIRIEQPPVRARAAGADLAAGTRTQVTLTLADPVRRRVEFTVAPPA